MVPPPPPPLLIIGRVKPNATAFNAFHRMYLPQPLPPRQAPGEQLVTTVLFKHIQVQWEWR